MSESPTDFRNQLIELTARLSSNVAEKLAFWSKDMEPRERMRIMDMIEGQLPTVIFNTIQKTPSLHNSEGVAYLERNLDEWSDHFAKKFIGK
jgi:hypothetical protein